MEKWKQRRESLVRRFSRSNSTKDTSADVLVVQLKFRLKDFEWDEEKCGELTKLSNDFYLYQWLKHTNFNVDSAESAVKKSFMWRKKNRISSSAKDIPDGCAAEFPIYMDAVSRTGTPVGSFGKLPAWDVRSFVDGSSDGGDKFVRYCGLMTLKAENIWLEHNLSLNYKFSDLPENMIYICTPVGLSVSQVASPRTVRCTIQVLKDIATNFPPIISQLIFVNVPRSFSFILKIIRPFLSFIRLEFYDRDENKWKKSLAEIIDPQQLRCQFGGTKT